MRETEMKELTGFKVSSPKSHLKKRRPQGKLLGTLLGKLQYINAKKYEDGYTLTDNRRIMHSTTVLYRSIPFYTRRSIQSMAVIMSAKTPVSSIVITSQFGKQLQPRANIAFAKRNCMALSSLPCNVSHVVLIFSNVSRIASASVKAP